MISLLKEKDRVIYTPKSTTAFHVQGVPHMIMGIASDPKESDRWWLLLEASCLARFGNALRHDRSDPFIVQPSTLIAISLRLDISSTNKIH